MPIAQLGARPTVIVTTVKVSVYVREPGPKRLLKTSVVVVTTPDFCVPVVAWTATVKLLITMMLSNATF